jgi:hypothetical protein
MRLIFYNLLMKKSEEKCLLPVIDFAFSGVQTERLEMARWRRCARPLCTMACTARPGMSHSCELGPNIDSRTARHRGVSPHVHSGGST